jgi:ATP-dependent DNA helicase RecG
LGRKGEYTRKRGLDRNTNKQLLLKHIRDSAKEGSRLDELLQVLPDLSRNQVQKLIQVLKSEQLVHNEGRTSGARWYPGPPDVQ